MSKQLKIERTSPTEGRVWSIDVNGIMQPVNVDGEGYIVSYGKCMDYVSKNQAELKTYKIARILHRKNAKRRTFSTIMMQDNNAAIQYFDQFEFTGPDARYELLTGDWKILAHKDVINNINGMSIII